ncbi:MAG TPA: S9 family peptidase [Planctomycetota bacterium]|nr:S9 family peptidase [Planctomycetota bacterium]
MVRPSRRSSAFAALRLACVLAGALPLVAQDTRPADVPFTLEDLYHPTSRRPLVVASLTSLEWLSDGVLQETRLNRAKRTAELHRIDPKTWESSPLLDESAVLAALTRAGASENAAREALGGGDLVWNEQRSGFVIAVDDDLFHVAVATGDGRRLTKTAGSEDEALFSPDGTKVAFLRGNDLYVASVVEGTETRLTRDGSETILNGRLDWVYQEELYGRGEWRGFWWSPDSSKLAYLRLDESKVPTFVVVDHRPLHQESHVAHYPKVGDPNPDARLGVVAATGGETRWMSDPYAGQEILISNVGWAADGRLLAQWQDRAQTWLDLVAFDDEGRGRTLLRETTKAWVERVGTMPRWLADGSFLWESDRDGFRHVYRHAADGSLLNPVTSGAWDVTEVHGVDEARGLLFFSAKERSPLTVDVYRVGLDGKELRRLTDRAGTHMMTRFSPDFAWFLDVVSDVDTPPQQSLHDGDGKVVRVIDANPAPAWRRARKGKVSFQQVKARDGVMLESMLVLPPDLPADAKIPTFVFLYGGPNAPQVADRFTRQIGFFHLLAQEGYATWVCDNRAASGKGWGSAWPVHRNFGEVELRDTLDGLEWVKAQPWCDPSRLAVHGWSYGGYMTLYAMTRTDVFKCGVAGAPVTDWRLYDTIYTERYMGLLADNAEGYDKSSILKRAADLKGKLLLIHGTMDDNVHPQNTLQLVDALHAAGKRCELMMLPGSDHSPRAPGNVWGQYSAIYDFIKRNL